MKGRQRAKAGVEVEARAQPAGPREPDPLYGVALMKAALELKRRPELSLEEVLRGVLERMRLPESGLLLYLEQHEGLKALLGRR